MSNKYTDLIEKTESQCEASRNAIMEVEWLLLNHDKSDGSKPWIRPLQAACQLVLRYTEDVIPELIDAIKELEERIDD